MRLGEDEHGRQKASCPECAGRVLGIHHSPAGVTSTKEWLPVFDDDFDGEHGFPLLPIPPALLNHCRPCAWVGCVHNLYLDVMDSGASIRLNFPGQKPAAGDPPSDPSDNVGETLAAMGETCTLDVADRGGATLDEVGKTINITRERVRQLIEQAMRGFKRAVTPGLRHAHIDIEDPDEIGEVRHPLEDVE